MLRFLLKQSLRNLGRNRLYTLVNGAGLAIAGAFALLVGLFALHENRVDRFHADAKRIYRVEISDVFAGSGKPEAKSWLHSLLGSAEEKNDLDMPLPLAIDLKKSFPEVQDAIRMEGTYQPLLHAGNDYFKEDGERVYFVDRNFFTFFTFSLLEGNPATAFPDENSVVVTERAARRFFGTAHAIGKTLTISQAPLETYTVSAIAKDFPAESSMQFEVLLPLESQSDYQNQMAGGTNNLSVLTLVKLREGTAPAAFRSKLLAFGKEYFKSLVEAMQGFSPNVTVANFQMGARSLAEAHYNKSSHWMYYTNLEDLIELLLLAFVGVLIACINYVLITMSRIATRSQELGIRRTLGAGSKAILLSSLTETFLLVLFSSIASFILAVLLLPFFNSLTNVHVSFQEIFRPEILLVFLTLALALTGLAGLYPALASAGVRPSGLMRKFSTYRVNPNLSRVFVAVQYTACITLLVFSLVIARQMHFVAHTDLGIARDPVVLVQNPLPYTDDYVQKTLQLREALRQYASSLPDVVDVTGSGRPYAAQTGINGHIIDGSRVLVNSLQVDYNYFSFNRIPILEGRAFSPAFLTDTERMMVPKSMRDTMSSATFSNIVVNETLYNMLGRPPLGVYNRPLGSYIIGVCKDYHFSGLQVAIGPAYHLCVPQYVQQFWFKVRNGQDLGPFLVGLRKQWPALTGNLPITYSFLDDDISKLYEADTRWLKIITAASLGVILIACLGLFGLSAIVAVNRTKEVGIRKVLGATVGQIYVTLNRSTLLIVLLSMVIAFPLARSVSGHWLESFAYRTGIGWWLYALAGAIALVCALGAVSFHSLKAARTNPVDTLRAE